MVKLDRLGTPETNPHQRLVIKSKSATEADDESSNPLILKILDNNNHSRRHTSLQIVSNEAKLSGHESVQLFRPAKDGDGEGEGEGEEWSCQKSSVKSQEQINLPQPAQSCPPPAKVGWRRYIGISLAAMASVCFSLAILIVKSVPQIHAFSFGVWRFLGIFIPSAPMLIVMKIRSAQDQKIFGTIWPLTERAKLKTFVFLILRCVLGCTAIVLQYYALSYMDIADATVIAFSTPCFVTLFAWVFLGESCGIVPIFAALCSLLGVTIVCRPPILQGESFNEHLLIGIALCFTAMICGTIVFIVLRCLRNTNVGLITCSFGFIGVVQCSILCAIIARFDIPQTAWEWCLVLSVGGLSFVGQTLITCSLRFEQASAISLVRSCDVIFAFVWQYIFLDVEPDLYSLLGSTLVIFSVFLIGVRKWVTDLGPEERARRRLWFILK